ncbi:MAG: tRNA (adenosine(37)-N6)-threonylcarbamoyltransferase complex ATPase subunit type 1 TsaE [Gammaproteobacteria bacterium]|nr:tRNA (adenosine(37)-N6)-threonylcarbamoyltransferase complex ATPase subunit type 1 TsaE [Gammaproteobacteria bacterium]
MAAIGAAIGRVLKPRACQRAVLVALQGPLGAGKTTLARGLLRGLGHDARVPSPTYTLVEPYVVEGLRVHHLDLYRLADEAELMFLGISDWIDEPGLTLIEWPERAPQLLARADLCLHADIDEPGRLLQLSGVADWLDELAVEASTKT